MRAESDFAEAISLAKQQSALSLELRAARSMANLFAAQGHEERGRQLMEGVLKRFQSEADIAGVLEGKFPPEFRYLPGSQSSQQLDFVVGKG